MDDKIIVDYVRMYHSEILHEPKYAVFKAAYPQLEQSRDVIVGALQVICEAIQPAVCAIMKEARREIEKRLKENE